MRPSTQFGSFGLIIKRFERKTPSSDPRQRAGADAEQQMAHYLHRRFDDDQEVCVLHDLRIEDPVQREHNGSPGVCQIDHLVMHRWGMFIVESKSVSQEVRVRPDGTGGDEWRRVYRGTEIGMASPIVQAKRQAEFLRSLLKRHQAELLRKRPLDLGRLAKLAITPSLHDFRLMPLQLIVAVSDQGKITRLDGWKERRKPFQVFVTKADLVPDKISDEIRRHRRGAGVISVQPLNEYGLWSMDSKEVVSVAEFLFRRHSDRSSRPKSNVDRTAAARELNPQFNDSNLPRGQPDVVPTCKHCGGTELTARSGRFGYHWSCGVCQKNTKMPVRCSVCKAERRKDDAVVKIRKSGPKYLRVCEACNTTELVWTQR